MLATENEHTKKKSNDKRLFYKYLFSDYTFTCYGCMDCDIQLTQLKGATLLHLVQPPLVAKAWMARKLLG